jgi:hypothetical protein
MEPRELADALLDAIDEAKTLPTRHLQQGGSNTLLHFRNALAEWKANTKKLVRAHFGRETAATFDAVGDPEVLGPTVPFLEEVIAKYDLFLSALATQVLAAASPSAETMSESEKDLDRPIAAFCSYASKDDPFREQLLTAIAMLERQGLLKIWHFRELEPGVEWDAEIRRQLSASQMILLLVSPDFLNSKYSWNEEVTYALKRHAEGSARVIPIIIRPCDWKHAPLNTLQALPKDGVPITQWSDRDAAWQNVTEGLRRSIASIRAAKPAPLAEGQRAVLDEFVSHGRKAGQVLPLNVFLTRADATNDVRSLIALGFVEHGPSGTVRLTAKGEKVAYMSRA